MQESKLFSKLLPSHPDILPIIKNIREKYNIPEIEPVDQGWIEIFLRDEEQEINWKIVLQDIKIQLLETPDLFPDDLIQQNNKLKTIPSNLYELNDLERIPEDLLEPILNILSTMLNLLSPIVTQIDVIINRLAADILKYILTGEVRDLPQGWFSQIMPVDFFGEEMLLGLASPLADPEIFAEEFIQKHKNLFGEKSKIKEIHLETAGFLRKKWEGHKIPDIIDMHIQQNREQFPDEPTSNEYITKKLRLEELFKKRMQRLEKTLDEFLGTKIS